MIVTASVPPAVRPSVAGSASGLRVTAISSTAAARERAAGDDPRDRARQAHVAHERPVERRAVVQQRVEHGVQRQPALALGDVRDEHQQRQREPGEREQDDAPAHRGEPAMRHYVSAAVRRWAKTFADSGPPNSHVFPSSLRTRLARTICRRL